MSTYEVEAIMGRPYLVSSKPDGVLVYVWTHVNGLTGSTRTFSVVFKNGKSLQPPEIPSSF
jgi:hypothetical protein